MTRRSPWVTYCSFCAVVFIITSVLVYRWGREVTGRRAGPKTYAVTARIDVSPIPAEGADVADFLGVDIRGALLEPPPPVEQAMIERSATGEHSPASSRGQPDSWGMTIRCRDGDADHTSQTAERLTGEATRLLRRAWKRHATERRSAAEDRSRAARARLRAARHRYEELVRQVVTGPSAAEAPQPEPEAEPPQPRENPDWQQLSRQLDQLRQERRGLLSQRTEAHPAVRDIDTNIAGLRQRLADTPRWLSANGSPPTRPQPPPPADASEPKQQLRRELDQRRRELEDAEVAYLDRLESERRRVEEIGEPLQIAVRFGEVTCLTASEGSLGAGPQPTGTAPFSPWGLAVAAGLTMAVALGLLAAGAAMEPTLDAVSELRKIPGIPVIAGVPAPVTLPPIHRRGGRTWLRAALCLGGLLVMAGCATLVWQTIL